MSLPTYCAYFTVSLSCHAGQFLQWFSFSPRGMWRCFVTHEQERLLLSLCGGWRPPLQSVLDLCFFSGSSWNFARCYSIIEPRTFKNGLTGFLTALLILFLLWVLTLPTVLKVTLMLWWSRWLSCSRSKVKRNKTVCDKGHGIVTISLDCNKAQGCWTQLVFSLFLNSSMPGFQESFTCMS